MRLFSSSSGLHTNVPESRLTVSDLVDMGCWLTFLLSLSLCYLIHACAACCLAAAPAAHSASDKMFIRIHFDTSPRPVRRATVYVSHPFLLPAVNTDLLTSVLHMAVRMRARGSTARVAVWRRAKRCCPDPLVLLLILASVLTTHWCQKDCLAGDTINF